MGHDGTESGQPEKKRPHFNSVSPPMARHSNSSPENKPVDAAVLQYQNQKLVQQLDVQKQELHDLEVKIKELRDKQSSYDDVLMTIDGLWNQLNDDLVLLGMLAGEGRRALQSLNHIDYCRGSIPSCPAEDTFLCRLLEADSVQSSGNVGSVGHIKESLARRHFFTGRLMKLLEDAVGAQIAKTTNVVLSLREKPSAEGATLQLFKLDDLMKDEANHLREVIDILDVKHKEYTALIESCNSAHSADESEIKHLEGELEERMSELEESRRKLVNMKMQKDIASVGHGAVSNVVNGSLSPEKLTDKTGLRDLRDSIEEAKVLAEDRLSELEYAQEDNLILSRQMQDLQNELRDDKYVFSSRPYSLLNDQLHHWKAEAEQYKVLTESLQTDRSLIAKKEKELIAKAEYADTAKKAIYEAEAKIEELEGQLQKCIIEKNDLEIKMEEAIQDSGKKDVKMEFQVMSSALTKEMSMIEAQLRRWKETAQEALSLREEAHTLKALLDSKTSEQKDLAAKCTQQMGEIKQLKGLMEKMQKENQETQIFLDLVSQQIYDNRNVTEIKESEHRAHLQAEVLKNALEEHGLELRVKAANEAETACQERLSAAEAEIVDLRAELDTSDRHVLELREAIKMKEREAATYISEMETIGQAYEDMQTQNQHLLQQMTDRDDYNIKLVSESVKTKQAQSFLLLEKQALTKQLQQANICVESLRKRIDESEEQMKVLIMEALKYTEEEKKISVNLEAGKWELSDAEKEMKWMKSAVASSEKEYEQIQRKMDEIQTELDNERTEKKKLNEELMELNRTVDELTSETGEAAIQKLQDEIKDCKAILKCGVCFDRPKEVVILKCYHLFCNPCIQRNLEIRHRKCPGCGTAFGQNDVRFVKI